MVLIGLVFMHGFLYSYYAAAKWCNRGDVTDL